MAFVKPKTYLIGATQLAYEGLHEYLMDTGQEEFLNFMHEYMNEVRPSMPHDHTTMLCMASFYAKMCYQSLVLGKNENVKKIRSITDNLKGTIDSGHGSVFEHCTMNFITTGCSKVFLAQLTRHRPGAAYSIQSGHFCAVDNVDLVFPEEVLQESATVESIVQETGEMIQTMLRNLRKELIPEGSNYSMAYKKSLTSAIRRLAPEGAATQVGWSMNIRALRHVIELRTERTNDWEIRLVFNQVARLIFERWPLALYGGVCTTLEDGTHEWEGLRI
jgi:thymidylate synthase (FAD)